MSRPVLVQPLTKAHADHLRDESRRIGYADSIARPRSEAEVIAVLREAAAQGMAVTVQGARTGITAGAVPEGGLVLSLQRMNAVEALRRGPDGAWFIAVQPGMLLTDLRAVLRHSAIPGAGTWDAAQQAGLAAFRAAGQLRWPPDPTETSASVGGMVACNASGACSFRYGPTRNHVASARIVLADGDAIELRRGENPIAGRQFSLHTAGGRKLAGVLPAYALPAVKNAAGYYAAAGMDLLDLFIGAEGTLGVVTRAELRLAPAPPVIWGVTAFLPSLPAALRFVRAVRGERLEGVPPGAERPAAIELFDRHALDLLRLQKRERASFAWLPAIPAAGHTAVYVEYHCENETAADAAVDALAESLAACGGAAGDTWIATAAQEVELAMRFRHAVPEAVNLLIDERRRRAPGLTKLGTDMSVPAARLEDVMALYERDLAAAKLDYVIFGHIGDNHVHVNILPRDLAEYETGRGIVLAWAGEVTRWGGSISAEHGVGKLKVALLRTMYGDDGVAQMRAVKAVFDPHFRLNRGNLFAPHN